MPYDHRRDSAARQRGAGPLLTYAPLDPNREKKPQAQAPKRRRRPTPPTSAFNFDPKDRRIPNGKQDLVVSPHIPSQPAVLQPPTITHEQPPTPFDDRNTHALVPDGYDEQAPWPHVFTDPPVGHFIPPYPDTSYADAHDSSLVPPDPYDSPGSCTSSSSPAASDQSPRTADFGADYPSPTQPPVPMCPYDGQGYAAVSYGIQLDHYPDHPAQGYLVLGPIHGRPGLHGGPYPGNNGYPHPNFRGS